MHNRQSSEACQKIVSIAGKEMLRGRAVSDIDRSLSGASEQRDRQNQVPSEGGSSLRSGIYTVYRSGR